MAHIVRCDACQAESVPGRQWLRVRIEPFWPKGQRSGMEIESDCYNEGIIVDACGPQCAALALSIQAGVLAGNYENMSEAMLRTSKKLEAEDGR